MKTTIAVQIGNSDDKLSQLDWSAFVHKTNSVISKYADSIYFSGYSVPSAMWQNACWVFDCEGENASLLWKELENIREIFEQNSIAWTEGLTVFIK